MDFMNEGRLNIEESVLKIGTRDSILAMKQTNLVRDKLLKLHQSLSCDISSMKTLGDKILDVALSKIGSKSLFTKELEEALAQKCVHIVVHSLKDLPTCLPEGMVIGAVLKREDPRDAVLLHPRHQGSSLGQLPAGAVIGSSSVRRVAQLSRRFPSLVWRSVRGNLNTRLRKLDDGNQYDGLVLAAAGLHRMGWQNRVAQYLERCDCMYAVGQGALAVECLSSDAPTLALLRPLCHGPSLLAAVAERALMAALEGGCSAPVAVHTEVEEESMTLRGGVWSLDGKEELIEELSASLVEGGQLLSAVAGGDAAKESQDGSQVREEASSPHSTDEHRVNSSRDEGSSDGDDGVSSTRNGSAAANGDTVSSSEGDAAVPSSNEGSRTNQPHEKDTANGTSVSGLALNNGYKRSSEGEPSASSSKRLKADSTAELQGGLDPESFSGIVPPPDLVPAARLAHALGRRLAAVLLAKGAAKILAEAKAQNTVTAPNVKPAQQ